MNGEIGTGSSTLSQQDTGNDSDSIILDVDEPVSLSFASRYLSLFSKAGGLSSQVLLNMSNETPLMVMFKIMNGMGDIKYYLAPKITEEEWLFSIYGLSVLNLSWICLLQNFDIRILYMLRRKNH